MKFFIRKIRNPLYLLIGILSYHPAVLGGEVPLPPMNLGSTSFLDGQGSPGYLFENELNYYEADRLKDGSGHTIPGTNKLDTLVDIPHILYTTKCRLFGAYFGVEAFLPILVHGHIEFFEGPRGDSSGIGDLRVAPFILQWSNYCLFGRRFDSRLNINFVLPVGKYEADSPINPGSNVIIFNPYYAFTWMLTDKLEFSMRLHYLWCSKNHDPFVTIPAEEVKPGEAFHFNYALSYEVVKNLRLGVAGYFLQQTSDSQIYGDDFDNTRERAFAIGPGLLAQYQDWTFILNSYFETGVHNRFEGNRFVFRIVKVLKI